MYLIQMNIDNKRYRASKKGFFNNLAPYATAASGAALGFIVGGPAGALTGGSLGYKLGSGNLNEFVGDAADIATGGVMHALPISNKRKRE